MTISASVGFELTIERVSLRAYQLAGLMAAQEGTASPDWTAKADLARDFLGTILDEIQTDGVFRRSTTFETIVLVPNQFLYSLSSGTWDIIGNGSYISASESDITRASAETPVFQKDRATWQRMSAKSATTSNPNMFFVDASVFPIQVYIWPLPTEAGHIRFQTYRLMADATQGSKTLDIERYWAQYLIWELAHQLASAHSLPEDRIMRLAGMAAQKRERARAYANGNVANQMVLVHPTPWSGQ